MKAFDEKHIKNVTIVGAAKSGKTTLAETMMYEGGLIPRRGSVENKNTVSDYHEVEHERGSSVYATPLHTEWRSYKINLIDTPGLDDFVGEIIPSLRVADTCIMLLNAQNGVEVGTELLWNYVEQFRRPVIFAINQVDHPKADFDMTVESAKERFGNGVTLMQYPVNTGEGFNKIIDLLKMTMYEFPPEGGKPNKLPIPDSEKEKANRLHNELVEKAAENDEGLMELYFEKGELDEDEMRQGLKIGMMKQQVYPVFCMSAEKDMGSGRMMGFIDNVAPSSLESPPLETEQGKGISYDPGKPPVLFVFRTFIEPHLGQLSVFKVISGEVHTGMELENEQTREVERLGQLYIMDGKKRTAVDKLVTGDIGVIMKLKGTKTNHTLHEKGESVAVKPTTFPDARMVMVIESEEGGEDKLSEALHAIQDEDPTIKVHYSKELKQLLISAQGELHLSLVEWKLNHLYGQKVRFNAPRIAYRETIQKSAIASYRHKKQSGGAGQFGEVHLKIEPYVEGMPEPTEYNVRGKEEVDLPWGGKLVFYNCIVGGVIDTRFIPSIKKGILEKMEEGPLTGSYVRDVRVMVFDGKMHPVDSNDVSFKIAGMMAFKEAFENANPKILEPVQELEVVVPEELMGDVMTDLQTRRSVITGMDNKGNYKVIKSNTPLAELDRYSTSLRSITQGRGNFSGKFHDYQAVPGEIQKKLIDTYQSTNGVSN